MAPASPSVQSTLLTPLADLAANCAAFRHCPSLPDEAWLALGTMRALHDQVSGRAFLQQIGSQWAQCPERSHFFETLKSQRRLALCQQASTQVARLLIDDPFAHLECLRNFDLYAADGHWHGAAGHDVPLEGSKRAIGHFFAVNMRTQALHHRTHAQGKKEHDRHALKRLDLATLRHDAPSVARSSTPTTAPPSTMPNGRNGNKAAAFISFP